MKKALLVLVLFFIGIFAVIPAKAHAEASIPSFDFTWTGYNPTGYVFYVYGTQNVAGLSSVVVNVPTRDNVLKNSYMTLQSASASYSQVVYFKDLLTPNQDTQTLFYVNFALFPNYQTIEENTDVQVEFNIIYINAYGITTTQQAINYTNTNFGMYEPQHFWLSYGPGYADGYDAGYQDGIIDGEAGGYIDGYHDGETSGYQDGYEAGYDDAYTDACQESQTGAYNQGFADGQNVDDDINLLVMLPAMILGQLWQIAVIFLNFEVFGLSLWALASAIGLVLFAIILIKWLI